MISTSFGEIRQWRKDDAQSLVKYANNRNVWLNLRDAFPHPYTDASAQAFLEIAARQNPTTFFAIATPEGAIGGIGVVLKSDVHRLTAELGYWLGEPFWGKGIMSEAVSKFADYAFQQYKLVRLFAEAYAYNAGSCRVLEKAGFTFEGRMRASAFKDGQIIDQLIYSQVKMPSAG